MNTKRTPANLARPQTRSPEPAAEKMRKLPVLLAAAFTLALAMSAASAADGPFPDSDGDGVPDFADACPGFDDNINTDGDPFPNGCDNCPNESNEAQADADKDGVGNACDACPGFNDADDGDADGLPDACDPCAGGAQSGDTNGDGDFDLDDYAVLFECLTSPEPAEGCDCFQYDQDDDVDLADVAAAFRTFFPIQGCLIDGETYEPGQRDEAPNGCRSCQPGIDRFNWTLSSKGTVCREGSGDMCDPDEVCNGESLSCPEEFIEGNETMCRAGSGDACDPDEFCTGEPGAPCPDDEIASSEVVCRQGADDICDPDETCPGKPGLGCPADVFAGAKTVCRVGSGDLCDPDEFCTGEPGAGCPEDVVLAGGICRQRPVDQTCDRWESCTGIPGEPCPPDEFIEDFVTCRPADGPCDIPETCTGTSPNCPPDEFDQTGSLCRPAGDLCDVDEFCDGTTAACPIDEVRGPDETCRSRIGNCDVSETCDGVNKSCPPDQLRPAGFLCRDRGGLCDTVAEFCTGNSPTCPLDANDYNNNELACRPSVGPCDETEYCGQGGPAYPGCPADDFAPAGTICRDINPSDGPNFQACEAVEVCTGTSSTCPGNANLPDGTPCIRGNGADGICRDIMRNGFLDSKCIEINTVPDGGECSANLDCVSGNCIEMFDRTTVCAPAGKVGFGGTCDGKDFVQEGDPNGRQCAQDNRSGGQDLFCCEGTRAAEDGETGTCQECCRNDDTTGGTGKGILGCENRGSKSECCNGRCIDATTDPFNCGQCGFSCYDQLSACRTEVIECLGQGDCVYETPCSDTEACATSLGGAFSCFQMEFDSDPSCNECTVDGDCGFGDEFCWNGCGGDDGAAYGTIFCVNPSYCATEPGGCGD